MLDNVTVECVHPGFINFSLSSQLLQKELIDIYHDARMGVALTSSSKRILIDYGGPNIAKPLHVGHIRSAVIGDCLKRLARFLGHDVISDIHLGDWGKPMGLVILGLMEKYDLSCYFAASYDVSLEPPFNVDDFSELYPYASARSKTDTEFNEKALDITARLQNRENGYYDIWKDVCRLSIEDIKSNYELLDISFDLWCGESSADPYVESMIEKFIFDGHAFMSEGALVIEVREDTDTAPMPPVLLKKSNGALIYASTDLATMVQRMEILNPDEMWYIVDGRQKLHFEQIFRAARKTNVVPITTKLYHIPFGTVNGKDGKPYKTREGGTMKLYDLVEIVTQSAMLKSDIAKNDFEIARKIGVAALKFGDLVNNRNKNYTFDIEKFIQFEGKTGTYI